MIRLLFHFGGIPLRHHFIIPLPRLSIEAGRIYKKRVAVSDEKRADTKMLPCQPLVLIF
jgi:hypothetical protein